MSKVVQFEIRGNRLENGQFRKLLYYTLGVRREEVHSVLNAYKDGMRCSNGDIPKLVITANPEQFVNFLCKRDFRGFTNSWKELNVKLMPCDAPAIRPIQQVNVTERIIVC